MVSLVQENMIMKMKIEIKIKTKCCSTEEMI